MADTKKKSTGPSKADLAKMAAAARKDAQSQKKAARIAKHNARYAKQTPEGMTTTEWKKARRPIAVSANGAVAV